MKILRLDLTAFGPFSNRTLSLEKGQYGLHLVFGPNEAGKSSSLRALHHWLYGIPNSSSDNFLHPYPALRIGGLLESSVGKRLEVIRRKGQKNTLRGGDDVKVISDGELTEMLGGVDSGTFSRQYGITYDELKTGGRAIVSGGGDLGEILFAAGSGLADLGQVQKDLSNESDALFKKQGRSQRITQAISDLAGIRRTIREATLSTSDWLARDAALQAATRQQQTLEEELKTLRIQASRWERILAALPLIQQRRILSVQLADLKDVPLLPEDFRSQRTEAQRQLRMQEHLIQEASETLSSLQSRIDAVHVPEGVLQHRTMITQLHTELGGIEKAARDRPQLVSRTENSLQQLSKLLQDLGHAPGFERLEELRISKAQRQRIQSLAGDWRSLMEREHAVSQQASKLQSSLKRADQQLSELPEPVDVAETRRAIRRAQKAGDLDQQLIQSRHLQTEQQQQAAIALQQLGLWSGSLEKLERLAIPSLETIERFENEHRDFQSEMKRLSSRVDDLNESIQRLDQQLEQLRLQHDLPSEEDLKSAREKRDRDWQSLRQFLDSSTDPQPAGEHSGDLSLRDLGLEFQASLEQADRIVDRLRHEAERVAEQSALTAARQAAEEERNKHSQSLAAGEQAVGKLLGDWETLWGNLGIAPLSPREMRPWMNQQRQIVAMAARIRQQQTSTVQLETRISELRGELLKTLPEHVRSTHTGLQELSLLIELTEEFLTEADTNHRQRQKLEDRQKSLQEESAQAQAELESARRKMEKWSEDWKSAVTALRLERSATPEEATLVLESIDQIFQIHKDVSELQERITGIDRDAEQFQDAVRQLLERVAPDLQTLSAPQAIADLSDRLSTASTAQAKLQEWQDSLDAEQRRLEAARNAARHFAEELQGLCQTASCQQPDELPDIEQRAEQRRTLQQEFDSATRQLLHQAARDSLEEFEREAEGVDQDELKARLKQLQDEIARRELEKTDVVRSVGEHSAMLQQMNGSPQAAAAQEQAEQVLAQIRDDAEHYLRLRLASRILQQTVDRFREASQGPVLKRACELFSHLTLGAFAGIRPEYDEKGNAVLVGIRAGDHQEVHVSGMSEGTCDQLYLALRVALLEQALQIREPLPLIVDDILVMFDDDRATAALQMLVDLSAKTQVILFTHHAHVVQLAQDLGRNEAVFVHSLSP